MANRDVVVKADRIRNWKRLGKFVRLSILLVLLLLIIFYIVLKLIFNDGSFIVSLDNNDMLYSGLAMYETLNDPTPKRRLKAEEVQFLDNISIKWLPKDITEYEGSHNGKNYIAYSFYMENQGKTVLNYWYSIVMDDVILNADDAIRIMIYVNDQQTVYAKGSSIDGSPEPGTTKFRDDEDGNLTLC